MIIKHTVHLHRIVELKGVVLSWNLRWVYNPMRSWNQN